jgi:hypothetical protein
MLYHVELGFPKSIKKISGMFLLDYTEHAIKASKNDSTGFTQRPEGGEEILPVLFNQWLQARD